MGQLSVESDIENNEFLRYTVFHNSDLVLEATVYKDKSTVTWSPMPKLSTDDYIRRIAEFHEEIVAGEYIQTNGRTPGISVSKEGGWTKEPIEKLGEELLICPHFPDLEELTIKTPYCEIKLIGEENTRWTPEKGQVQVTAAQDISNPLSTLLMNTSLNYALPSDIIQFLQEKVYQFD